jgi:hypothetical protein
MPIADWTVPFLLTSQVYSATLLDINTPLTFSAGQGVYLLREDGCSLKNTVRETKNDVPQADGAILHRRFVSGMEMTLAIQLWESTDHPACDALLQEMLDTLMGYLFNLINAGDNQGRISWQPDGVNARMLDDLRLFTYPEESHPGTLVEIGVTLDCELPYAEDLTQLNPVVSGVVTNGGNRPTYPVWKIDGPFTSFGLQNTTTGDEFIYNGTLPGATPVGPLEYLEINTFKNTVYLNGAGLNYKPGIDMANSDFFTLPPGNNTIVVTGASGHALVNAAWA